MSLKLTLQRTNMNFKASVGLLCCCRSLRELTSPVSFSVLENGEVVRGLSGVPATERPLLFIGNHQTWAPGLGIVIDEILTEAKILARGLAHPMALGGPFSSPSETDRVSSQNPVGDFFRLFGAVPVSGKNLYKLMANNDAALLFPGGVREAYRKKVADSPLMTWPAVRMDINGYFALLAG